MSNLEAPVWVVGAGGHAKVVISTLKLVGQNLAGILDDDPEKVGTSLLGVAVVDTTNLLTDLPGAWAILALGKNTHRKRLATSFPLVQWLSVVHPAAFVDPSATVAEGAVAFAGAIVQTETSIGAHAIVNSNASIDHDSEVGAFAHVAPGTTIAGGVHIGEGVFIGAGATVIPGCRLGSWSTVGAGAVVIRDVPDGATVAGVPARSLRTT